MACRADCVCSSIVEGIAINLLNSVHRLPHVIQSLLRWCLLSIVCLLCVQDQHMQWLQEVNSFSLATKCSVS